MVLVCSELHDDRCKAGSPTLSPSMRRFKPTPNDDMYLSTANTCISRLCIALYSSKNILRQKLFFAIKIKTFGFNNFKIYFMVEYLV
ncbi:E3 ubiquitin-protein ligase UBR5 [Trichinella sp. T8]|nr:E3 ubiquitin-protein ligase UBR5 [Trichinella sp. T8]